MSNAPTSHDQELQAFMEQVLKTYGSNGMSQEQNLAALQLYYQHLSEQEEELAKLAQNTKSEEVALIIYCSFINDVRKEATEGYDPANERERRKNVRRKMMALEAMMQQMPNKYGSANIQPEELLSCK